MAPTITETGYAWCAQAGKFSGQLIHPTIPSDAIYGITYTLYADGDWPDLMPGDVVITTDDTYWSVDFPNTDGTSGLLWRVVDDTTQHRWSYSGTGYAAAWYWIIRNGNQTAPILSYQKATVTASGRDAVLASWPTPTVTGPAGSTAIYLPMSWRQDYWAEQGWYSQSPAWYEQDDWDIPGVWTPRLSIDSYVDGEWRYGLNTWLMDWDHTYGAEGNPAAGSGLDANEFVGHRVHRGYAGGAVADIDLPRILVAAVQT